MYIWLLHYIRYERVKEALNKIGLRSYRCVFLVIFVFSDAHEEFVHNIHRIFYFKCLNSYFCFDSEMTTFMFWSDCLWGIWTKLMHLISVDCHTRRSNRVVWLCVCANRTKCKPADLETLKMLNSLRCDYQLS